MEPHARRSGDTGLSPGGPRSIQPIADSHALGRRDPSALRTLSGRRSRPPGASALRRVLPVAYAGDRLTASERAIAKTRGIVPADRERLVDALTCTLDRRPDAVMATRHALDSQRERASRALAFELAARGTGTGGAGQPAAGHDPGPLRSRCGRMGRRSPRSVHHHGRADANLDPTILLIGPSPASPRRDTERVDRIRPAQRRARRAPESDRPFDRHVTDPHRKLRAVPRSLMGDSRTTELVRHRPRQGARGADQRASLLLARLEPGTVVLSRG
jgi:hypothetical protein